MKERKSIEVIWNEERRTLTLEGEPVLEYSLSWPTVTGAGLGGRWISRYYARLAKGWRERWQREVYWKACIQLAQRREASRPFTPWQGELSGEVALCRDGLLSLRMFGSETRGDGRPNRVRWGDVWKVREGAPCPLDALGRGAKGWRGRLWRALAAQGESRRQGDDCFLDGDWVQKAKDARILRDYCLTEEGVELTIPQCAAAPAAEGCPVFLLSPGEVWGEEPEKHQ